MADSVTATPGYSGRTAWARNLAAPVRDFLSTETGSAAVLLAATVARSRVGELAVAARLYVGVEHDLSIQLGSGGISATLRQWVNEGLMTFFFLVVGLEAKREMDMGELRQRQRLTIPVMAAIGGMVVPVAIYLAVNAGGPGAHGWGAAMSTDTAFALGALALLTPRVATRLRVFLLTLAVFDDLGALLVIATVYTTHVVDAGAADRDRAVRRARRASVCAGRLAPPGVGRRRDRHLGGDVQVRDRSR